MSAFLSLHFLQGSADAGMLLAYLTSSDAKSQVEQSMFLNAGAGFVFFILCAIGKPEMTGAKVSAFCIALADALMLLAREGKAAPFFILLIPVFFIWFAEALGAFKGNVGRGGIINTETPDWMIAGFGWIVLLAASGFVVHDFLSVPARH